MRTYTTITIGLVLAWSGTVPSQAESLSPRQLQEDTRLAALVSVSSGRVYLGELIDMLSRQSGVKVDAEDKDGTSSEPIAIRVERMRLFDVLNGLWSILSYRGAKLDWKRDGAPGSYRYTLYRPLAARNLPDRLQQAMQLHGILEAKLDRHPELPQVEWGQARS